MYVRAEVQGKNIGSGLLSAVIGEAVHRFSTREIILEVTCKNIKAYKLYERMGFKEVSPHPGKKETLIVMKKRL